MTTNASEANQTKPHVLLVCDKWFNGSPARGLSNYMWGFVSTLKRSTYCTGDIFHFDDYVLTHGAPADRALYDLCEKTRPSVLFIAWTPPIWIEKIGDMSAPRLETLYRIRNELQIPIVIHLSDYYMECRRKLAEEVHPIADYITVSDCTLYKRFASAPEKYLFMLEPADPDIFKLDSSVERDVDVSFIGSTWCPNNYKGGVPRIDYILHLKKHVNLTVMGGRSNINSCHYQHQSKGLDIPIQDFAVMLQRSKLTINVGVHRDGNWQAKGRFHQAKLCGAMMLEAHHRDVDIFYEPYKEYVPFFDEKDAVDKVRYYLEHTNERLKIAEAGRLRALRDHTGEVFWRTLIKAVTVGGAADLVESLRCVGLDLINHKSAMSAVPYLSEYAEVNPTDEAYRLHARALALTNNDSGALNVLSNITNVKYSSSWEEHCREAIERWNINPSLYSIKLLESLIPAGTLIGKPEQLRRGIIFPPITSEKDWDLGNAGIQILALSMRLMLGHREGKIDIGALAKLSEIDNLYGLGAKTVHLINLSGILFERGEETKKTAQTIIDLAVAAFRKHALLSPEEMCLFATHYGEQSRARRAFKMAQEALELAPDNESVRLFCASFAPLIDYSHAKTGEMSFNPSHLALPPLVGVHGSINETIISYDAGKAQFLPQIDFQKSLSEEELALWSVIHRGAASQPGHFSKFAEFPWNGFVLPLDDNSKNTLFRTVDPPLSSEDMNKHLNAAILTYIADSQAYLEEAINRARHGWCGLLDSFIFVSSFFRDEAQVCFLNGSNTTSVTNRLRKKLIKVVGNKLTIGEHSFIVTSSFISEIQIGKNEIIKLKRPVHLPPRWRKACHEFKQHGSKLVNSIVREITGSEKQSIELHAVNGQLSEVTADRQVRN